MPDELTGHSMALELAFLVGWGVPWPAEDQTETRPTVVEMRYGSEDPDDGGVGLDAHSVDIELGTRIDAAVALCEVADAMELSIGESAVIELWSDGKMLRQSPFKVRRVSEDRFGLDFGFRDNSDISAMEIMTLATPKQARRVLDSGPALLEPITKREFAGIEGLLGVIWQAAAHERLSEPEQQMVLSIAEMIEQQRRESMPGETERWKLVGAVGSGLDYLLLKVPVGIIAWDKAQEYLATIDWSTLAGRLPGV